LQAGRPERRQPVKAGAEARTSKPTPFDIAIVYSFSRFFRDHFELEFGVCKLTGDAVKLVSITQEMDDDTSTFDDNVAGWGAKGKASP
jgi:site-specific DNA recombinase